MDEESRRGTALGVARRPAAGPIGGFLRDLWALLGYRALKLTFQQFQRDDATGLAAQLAYYLILALPPFLLVLVSLMSFFGNAQLAADVLGYFEQVMPKDVYNFINGYMDMESIFSGTAEAPWLFIFGILLTIWSASGAFSALINALNRAYDVQETRPFWKVKGIAILMTLGLPVLALLGVVLLVAGEHIGESLARFFGLDEVFVVVWEIVRWPVALLFMVLTVALLYYFAPDAGQPFRWITPGGFIGVILWVIASAAFSFYVNRLGEGSYNETYGTIGVAIVLLLYLYISSLTILFGATLNAILIRMKEEVSGEQILDAESANEKSNFLDDET